MITPVAEVKLYTFVLISVNTFGGNLKDRVSTGIITKFTASFKHI